MAAQRIFSARVSSNVTVALCIAILLAYPAAAQRYQFVIVPGNSDGVTDLNNAGTVCGYRFPNGFVWSQQNGLTEFFEFDVFETETAGMNNLGHVVGVIRDTDPVNYRHTMRWLGAGTAQDFESDGAVWSVAADINDIGQIAGDTSVPGQPVTHRRARFAHDSDSDGVIESNERVLLPTPAGIEPGYDLPIQIAENGLITGNSHFQATSWRFDTATQSWRALLLRDVQGGPRITAWGAGPAGQIVGDRAETPFHLPQAFVFVDANGNHVQDAGETVDLPQFATRASRAYDVNSAGDVVGKADGYPLYEDRATLWRDGRIIDLNCVAGFSPCINGFDEALAINDAGQVLVRSGRAYYILNEISSDPTIPDQDGDYACDCADNCAFFNPDQRDRDGDGIGDACDGCRGDLDGNGVVSLSDLANLLHNFGADGVPYNFGDLDGDQAVGLADLAILLANFGGVCV